jgi:sugar phosphate permease
VNPWRILSIAVAVQVAGVWLANAPVFLITHLHVERGLGLPLAGALAATTLAGTTLTLIVWGAIVDRIGERRALTIGLGIATISGFASAAPSSLAWLGITWFVLGVGAGSLNSASGRLIAGWFPPERRGTAMGIRQTALPLGTGLAAFFVPVLADARGIGIALIAPAIACALATAAVTAFIADPPEPPASGEAPPPATDNPYRGDRQLARVHLASMLLVVPQITVWTFIVVWLVDARGWSTAAAGGLAAATQVLGAAGRVGAGWWSDRLGDRLRPIRLIAGAAAATMLLLGLAEQTGLAVVVMVVATVVTVADNGLAFTAVAEIGGRAWSGRAMGIQNTGQYLAGSLVPPGIGALIATRGYGFAFAAVAFFALLALPIIPRQRTPLSAANQNQGKP